ncbi:MAG: ABC transporter substrate binding protein [Pseudolabrys sp.]
MRRREFIKVISGAAAWPIAAHAQQGERVRRIGVLIGLTESDTEGQARVAALKGGLEQAGWVNGKNARIEVFWAGGDTDLARRYAAELVASSPDVIVVNAPVGMVALQKETKTLPIVFVHVSNVTEWAWNERVKSRLRWLASLKSQIAALLSHRTASRRLTVIKSLDSRKNFKCPLSMAFLILHIAVD